jgi:hypothetical protein
MVIIYGTQENLLTNFQKYLWNNKLHIGFITSIDRHLGFLSLISKY